MQMEGLTGLAALGKAVTRSISAENPTGGKGMGSMAECVPGSLADRLGKNWKCAPCFSLPGRETTVIADIRGPGAITHLWFTNFEPVIRGIVLRIYWDGEETPSVQVPLGDFFACGHGKFTQVQSIPVFTVASGGLNCFWRMPFRKSCRITLENSFEGPVDAMFVQVDYQLCDIPDDAAHFHAYWNRVRVDVADPVCVIADIRGRGHYVGTYLAWEPKSPLWFGEGEVKCYIDGDTDYPTYNGTGTEDYFGGAWGFPAPYSGPYMGCPYIEPADQVAEGKFQRYGMYRFHIPDPIYFDREIRVLVQSLGVDLTEEGPKYKFNDDDIASVGYWYQAEPHRPFPEILPLDRRL